MSSTINLIKDDPYSPINRRISIVVLNHKTEQMLEKMNASPGLKQEDLDARLRQEKGKQEGSATSSLSSLQNLSPSVNSATLAATSEKTPELFARQESVQPQGTVPVAQDAIAAPGVAGQAMAGQVASEKTVQLVQGLGDSGYDIERIMPSPVRLPIRLLVRWWVPPRQPLFPHGRQSRFQPHRWYRKIKIRICPGKPRKLKILSLM